MKSRTKHAIIWSLQNGYNISVGDNSESYHDLEYSENYSAILEAITATEAPIFDINTPDKKAVAWVRTMYGDWEVDPDEDIIDCTAGPLFKRIDEHYETQVDTVYPEHQLVTKPELKLALFKEVAEELVERLKMVVVDMPSKGDKEEDCQRLCLLNKIYEVEYCINGTEPQDMVDEE